MCDLDATTDTSNNTRQGPYQAVLSQSRKQNIGIARRIEAKS